MKSGRSLKEQWGEKTKKKKKKNEKAGGVTARN